jgi:hypothetical protein
LLHEVIFTKKNGNDLAFPTIKHYGVSGIHRPFCYVHASFVGGGEIVLHPVYVFPVGERFHTDDDDWPEHVSLRDL